MPSPSRWTRFWHEPVRAERLALTRILFAGALLVEQLAVYLPHLELLYGGTGYAPGGWLSKMQYEEGRWTALFFNTDSPVALYAVFAIWVSATIAMLLGWRTRIATALTWFGTLCFANRNPWLLNHGDDVLLIALFLLMLSPCGQIWSLDARRRRSSNKLSSRWIEPWSVRLFQIQLCMIYFSTGLAKTFGTTWWDGTSIHFALLDPVRSRWPAESLLLPTWMTASLTWGTLALELGFWLLVLIPQTRRLALWAGIGLHLGILALMEAGWFSFYMIATYGVWYAPRRTNTV